jgi:hypothetical protein
MKTESDRTWGEVVESDEIYSAATGRWYEVLSSSRTGTKMRVRAKGLTKMIVKEVGAPVRLRRGPTGDAVDMFAVLFSGPTSPNPGEPPAEDESEES